MAKILTENDIEVGLVRCLTGTFGYRHIQACPGGDEMAWKERLDDGTGRSNKREVVLPEVLRRKLRELNAQVPEETIAQVVAETATYYGREGTSLALNKRLYAEVRDGRTVTFATSDKGPQQQLLKFIDFHDWRKNDFCAVRQMWIRGVDEAWRRPDVILFVNGLPLVFIELKNADVKVETAYIRNLQDYRATIPNLFAHNQICVLSNGCETRVGAFSSNYEHFFEWLRTEEEDARVDRTALHRLRDVYEGCSLEYLAKGLLEPRRLLDYLEHFILFDGTEGAPVKILAKTHQYLGVNRAVERVRCREALAGKLGVFFHTQGSGKSYSMVFLAKKVLRSLSSDFSFVIVTDRENLDGQIAKIFRRCGLIQEKDPCHPATAIQLRETLRNPPHFTFTLIQKFAEEAGREYPVLNERNNLIVIVDEAHRSQYESLAANMRTALPNANFIAFTGTPLGKTGEWFGTTISEYNFADAIADGSTVPIYYVNAAPQVDLCKEMLDSEVEEIGDMEGLALDEREKFERHFASEIEVLTRRDRIQENARKIVEHFVNRAYRGKGMVVAVDRYTAVRYYQEVKTYWPIYRAEVRKRQIHANDPEEETRLKEVLAYMDRLEMAVVISEDAQEAERFAEHGIEGIQEIRARINRIDEEGADIEDNFKNPEHPLALVFVCAMWLTGTDVPQMSTLYLDKPMKGHTLMQTIARVNRVYPGKHHGLIVDFVNIFKYVKRALGIYVKGGINSTLPVKPVNELIDALNRAVAGTVDYLKDLGVDLAQVYRLPKGSSFAQLPIFDRFLETILTKDDYRNRFFLFTNKINQIWDSAKPEVFEYAQQLHPALKALRYLRAVFDTKTDRSRLDVAVARLRKVLDDRVEVTRDRVAMSKQQEIDLSRINFESCKVHWQTANYQQLFVDDLRKVIEAELNKLMARNVTRVRFSERYQRVIDDYNAGTAESEQALQELIALIQEMKAEEQRAAREGLTEQQLEIYDILCQGKPLTQAQEKAAKLAAKDLVTAIKACANDLFTEEWFRYQSNRNKVNSFIRDTLAEPLDGFFDFQRFTVSAQEIYTLFLDRARNGKPLLPAA